MARSSCPWKNQPSSSQTAASPAPSSPLADRGFAEPDHLPHVVAADHPLPPWEFLLGFLNPPFRCLHQRFCPQFHLAKEHERCLQEAPQVLSGAHVVQFNGPLEALDGERFLAFKRRICP